MLYTLVGYLVSLGRSCFFSEYANACVGSFTVRIEDLDVDRLDDLFFLGHVVIGYRSVFGRQQRVVLDPG